MKKLFIFLVLAVAVLLSACSDDDIKRAGPAVNEKDPVEKRNEPTQKAPDVKLKEEAEPVGWLDVAIEKVAEDTKVSTSGEVDNDTAAGDQFVLGAEEGPFLVMNNTREKFKKGDRVTVYGIFTGFNKENQLPIINATVIEKE